MINPNELRIGNKVNFKFNPEQQAQVVTVAWISDDSIGYKEQHEASYPQSPKSFSGIPLTPEWLERCEFIDPAGNGMGYRKNVNSVDELCWYLQDKHLHYQTQGSGFTRVLQHIKHVHQLQNWWHSFTGEELQFKSI